MLVGYRQVRLHRCSLFDQSPGSCLNACWLFWLGFVMGRQAYEQQPYSRTSSVATYWDVCKPDNSMCRKLVMYIALVVPVCCSVLVLLSCWYNWAWTAFP